MGALHLLIALAVQTSSPVRPDSSSPPASPDTTGLVARVLADRRVDVDSRRAYGIGYERASDAIQYNRVQGLSIGAGYRARVRGLQFTDLFVTVRYGFSDERVTGRFAFVYDAPGGRFTLAGYRQIGDVDPVSPGRTLANAANALLTAHDDADYYLAMGGGASVEAPLATGLALRLDARGERQRSVVTTARSAVNDWLGGTGLFPPNPPVRDGTYGVLGARLSGIAWVRWAASVEAQAGEGESGIRALADVRKSFGGDRGATIRLKSGITNATALELPQLSFRAGGPQTVRGYTYGAQLGRAFWSAQLDVTPIGGSFRPVFFVDAGRASEPGSLFSGDVLTGGGLGLSVYSKLLGTSLFRLDFSRPLQGRSDWRVDVVFQAVR